jgi:hypothetical protein
MSPFDRRHGLDDDVLGPRGDGIICETADGEKAEENEEAFHGGLERRLTAQ